MEQKIEDVTLKVAIGLGGGGCIVEVTKGSEMVKTDTAEYGGCLDDFFYEGSVPPKEPGVYLFSGSMHGIPGSDEFPCYRGTFEPAP